ncbi:sulfite exporter TauE/SafE family protein [Thermosipho ferrireducens]|uniref:Probable membrane transporter protein n=1 Tax=Thermosipho ferrireducens TaxID=2571116 RepID=A0ABX7S7P5_9BACT|nr:sulfite exporter TauE/SafE family protein [Thermosipho ferrireducens]QTA37825.1 sulfite exporter TauE/SafE family protein [Thermosipho ferrireducens]
MGIILYFFLFLAGLGAGFVNVLAGGGSMLTLPALTLLGLDISVANGTNRVGILLQNIVASTGFKKGKMLDLKRATFLAIPSTLGAISGTFTVLAINKSLLEKIVGAIFLIMSVFILYKPKIWEEGKKVEKNNIISFIAFYFVGFYGGFIQAGVGFFLIMSLIFIEGYNIVKTNAIKVFIVMCYTTFSFVIFLMNGKVDIIKGLILALGTMTGAKIGTSFALKSGAKFVRFIVFVMIVVSAIKYLL